MLEFKLQIRCHLHNLSFSLLIPEPMCPVNTGLTWFVALQLLKRRHRRGTGDGCRRDGGSFSPSSLGARQAHAKKTNPALANMFDGCAGLYLQVAKSLKVLVRFKCRFYRQRRRAEKV